MDDSRGPNRNGSERRRQRRSPVRLRFLLRLQKEAQWDEVAALNISRTGAFLSPSWRLKIGNKVTMHLVDDGEVSAEATVVRQGQFMGERGVGVCFDQLDDAMLSLIAKVLEDEFEFQDYALESLLAAGGMAEVYRARVKSGPLLEEYVALKRLRAELVAEPGILKLLETEAEVGQILNHQGIVKVLDVNRLGGCVYLVQELVEGPSLRQILERAKQRQVSFPIGVACAISVQLAEALNYLHTYREPNGEPLKLVHRDIAPANILLDKHGQSKLTDFGVVAVGQDPGGRKIIAGKAPYVAPEQLYGRDLSPATDLFGLGTVLFELLVGRPAFAGQSKKEIWRNIKRGHVSPPSKLRDGIPDELDDIVLRLLSPRRPGGIDDTWSSKYLSFFRPQPMERFGDAISVRAALAPLGCDRHGLVKFVQTLGF